MQSYNPSATCPKCCCGTITTRFKNSWLGQVLLRSCCRCGYEWNEKPLDDVTSQDERDATGKLCK